MRRYSSICEKHLCGDITRTIGQFDTLILCTLVYSKVYNNNKQDMHAHITITSYISIPFMTVMRISERIYIITPSFISYKLCIYFNASSAIPYSGYISFRKMFVLSRTRDFRSFYFRSCVDITN